MKTLIAYFSWSGSTKALVEETNESFGYDIYRIERAKPYSRDYSTCAYIEAKEEVEKHIHPEIKKLSFDKDDYARILLFFPIWWYTFPMPIATFIEELEGYKGEIIVFANSYTNDPQYMTNSMKGLKALDGKIKFKEGLFNKSASAHVEFIKKENK